MVEPKNPITVIKDNKEYPAAECYNLEAPFILKGSFIETELTGLIGTDSEIILGIAPGEKPIYFKRKQIKNSLSSKGLKQTLVSIKYCLGKISKDGEKIEYWISPEGVLL